MSTSIKSQTINGFKWGLVDNFANSGITFLIGLVLANLLNPEEFGVLGIITIFINLSITIIDGGLATALIRKKEVSEIEYNTVFYSNLFVSVCLMLLLLTGSTYIARFFEQPILKETLSVMSGVLIINTLSIIPKTILIKKLDFKNQAIFSLVASLTSGAIGVVMAMQGCGVWSLVGQQIARQILMAIGFWLVCRWLPRLQFSVSAFKDLFGFGSKLLAANLVNSLFKDAFLAVVGKIYSAQQLGYYNRGEQFSTILSSNFAQIVRKVSLPALSKIKDDEERLRLMYRKLIIYIAIVSFTAIFVLAAVAEPLIVILVGEKWLPSVLLLRIMCLYAAIYPLNMLNLNVLNLKKRSDRLFVLEIIKKILFIPVIVVGFFFDIEIMLLAAVVYYYIEFFINGYYSHQLIGYGVWQQFKDLFPFYVISLLIAVGVGCLSFVAMPYWLILLLQIFVFIILSIAIYKILGVPEYKEIEQYCINKLCRR